MTKYDFVKKMLKFGSDLEKSKIPIESGVIINEAIKLYDDHIKEVLYNDRNK